jgi:hypothetical protein
MSYLTYIYIYIYIYIYMPFSRRFYPKRLTVMCAYILRMGGPGDETWECHQMKIIKGKWLMLMLFLTFVTPLLGWKMAVWFSVARRWPNIIAWCAFSVKLFWNQTLAGLTRSFFKMVYNTFNFNYEISVVGIWPCNSTGCWRPTYPRDSFP